MIKEAYVSFETAKMLKDKGFDVPTDHFYSPNGDIQKSSGLYPNCETNVTISAPTLQMAMAWLREKHIIIVIQPEYFNADSIVSYWGCDIWVGDNYEKLQGDFISYEEAVEAALKYCLKNL